MDPAAYLEYYALEEPPFGSTPDRFVFSGQSFVSATARLTEALRRRENLVVVTGQSGTGKTTLYRLVLPLAKPAFLSIIVDPFLGPEDLLKHVLRDFGVASDEKLEALSPRRTNCHDLLLMLDRFLTAASPLSAPAVIVIDDAQHMQRRVFDQLRVLSNLESDAGKLVQIILVGEPELDALLQKPEACQLGRRVACRIILEPLSVAEVRDYIAHRLAAARPEGKTEQLPFSSTAVYTLAKLSRGIPRVVNAICDKALETGFERGARPITRPILLESARELRLPKKLAAKLLDTRVLAGVVLAAVLTSMAIMAGAWIWLGRSALAPGRTAASPRTPLVAEGPLATGTLEEADSYVVVAASTTTEQSAVDIASKLEALRLPAFARREEAGGPYVVCVGPYGSLDEAQKIQKEVAGQHFTDSRIQVQRH
jgi:general secretion pathway protein A